MSTAAAPAPQRRPFSRIVALSLPVASAYVPLGTALGVLVVKNDLAWFWAPVSALVIFAGSAEFLAVGLMAAAAPVLQVAVVALAVNFRHIFYGLTFPLHRVRNPLAKAYGVWALTDEAYALTLTGEGAELAGREITLLQGVCQFWWVGGALLGSLLGQVIPDNVVGFGFALTSMFVLLLVDALRTHLVVANVLGAVLSTVLAFASEALWPGTFLVVGLLAYLVWVTVRYLRADPWQRKVLS